MVKAAIRPPAVAVSYTFLNFFLLAANFKKIKNVYEVVMSLLSLLQLCTCQLSHFCVFDAVFHLGCF